jgi:hypothetical protein
MTLVDMSRVQTWRWPRREYERIIEAGALTPEDRVELIDGEILRYRRMDR